MKKRIALVIALVLCSVFMLSSCTGIYTRPAVPGTQDTSYAVLSNGGSAVQYGNYVYFINGFRGYNDDDGKQNVLGKVEKGGLYRAELVNHAGTGGRKTRDYSFYYGDVKLDVFEGSFNTVDPEFELDSRLEFKHKVNKVIDEYEKDDDGEYELDENDEKIPYLWHYEYEVEVELIAPKTIGTSGYQQGGIFIFDNYVFYASPNNNKNKSGDVQFNKTDFFRTTLDGSKTQKIYTTNNDSSSSEYMFYKYNGDYYLVVYDGTDIVSVKMSDKINAKLNPRVIAENATSVYFPSKDIYYNFKDGEGKTVATWEHGVEDFVYYIRAATKEDRKTKGDVMEMLRPDGQEPILLSNDGDTVKVLGSDNGVLFYEIYNRTTSRTIIYSNLHSILIQHSPSYKTAHDTANLGIGNISGSMPVISTSEYNSVKCIYPNPKNINEPYLITFGSAINIHTPDGLAYTLFEGDATFFKIIENRLYFINNSALKYVEWDKPGLAVTVVSDATATSATFAYDIMGDYVVYFGRVDQYADQYAKFKLIREVEAESIFAGARIEADRKPEEE